jgi:hypothetical protein
MSFYEELLTPGDALYARGPSRRDHGEPNSEGSGTAPGRPPIPIRHISST